MHLSEAQYCRSNTWWKKDPTNLNLPVLFWWDILSNLFNTSIVQKTVIIFKVSRNIFGETIASIVLRITLLAAAPCRNSDPVISYKKWLRWRSCWWHYHAHWQPRTVVGWFPQMWRWLFRGERTQRAQVWTVSLEAKGCPLRVFLGRYYYKLL